MNQQTLSLYITAEHPCGYYTDRSSANLIPDPQIRMTNNLYSLLVSRGFRRSGGFVYRPHCPACSSCTPCRIDVEAFTPNRNQRRCLKHNNDIVTRIKQAEFSEEYFQLYRRYINRRHGDGSMADPEEADFRQFLLSDWSKTLFIESRIGEKLIAVAVADFLPAGLSAVYSFFEPDEDKRSLGTFAILQQVWLARCYQLSHVYLGYWIENHPKMDYKKHFAALQAYDEPLWKPFGE